MQKTNETEQSEVTSTLVSRNITVMGRRTSVRLEPEMWACLREIAERERCKIHDVCTLIAMRKKEGTSLTAAIRVFVMLYFRAASTETGHVQAAHGDFRNMIARAKVPEQDSRYFSMTKNSGENRLRQMDNLWAA
jgi:predicted DNA-binding ribbon-helix-helix protein